MKTPPDAPDPLSHDLARWQVNPPRDPNFRPAVWQRLRGLPPGGETWGSYLRAHSVGWVAVAALAVAVAGWAGHEMGRSQLETSRERMVVSYLSELDPRVLAKASVSP